MEDKLPERPRGPIHYYRGVLGVLETIMNRRTFITRSAYAASAVSGVLATSLYLDDQPMLPAPQREGFVLCDLHTHTVTTTPDDQITRMLASQGLVGITARSDNKGILTYEKAIKMVKYSPTFHELTPGQLAKFDKGYFLRTQELNAGIHHLLALGWEGDYFPAFHYVEEAVQAIHDGGGLVGLMHPYTISERSRFRLASPQEQKHIIEACAAVDFVEVHNGHNIDLIPGFMLAQSNALAQALVQSQCYGKQSDVPPDIVSSDAHHPEQIKTSGVYVPETSLENLNTLKKALQTHLSYHAATISRGSFLKGLVLPRMQRMLVI